jgi:rfaE bifunctional protein nucleotidyltransferase chain/domain
MNKLDFLKTRIFTWEEVEKQCHIWRFKDKKIVFTNGCFDLLHLGHIEYLVKASVFGDALIVGLNSDASTRMIKGDHRPIMDENSRAMVLASLRFVDAVVLFDQQTPYELIRLIQPDILIKGEDYKVEEIVGHDIVQAHGGKVITIELSEGYSTSSIVKKFFPLINPNATSTEWLKQKQPSSAATVERSLQNGLADARHAANGIHLWKKLSSARRKVRLLLPLKRSDHPCR